MRRSGAIWCRPGPTPTCPPSFTEHGRVRACACWIPSRPKPALQIGPYLWVSAPRRGNRRLPGPAVRPVAADQRVGRAIVVQIRLLRAVQFRQDPLREHLAEFHAPLVERVDVPDRALREHTVLIEGN